MENNQILISLQFSNYKRIEEPTPHFLKNEFEDYYIELFVMKDITLGQLFEGIKYGLEKTARKENVDVYTKCLNIYSNCIEKKADMQFERLKSRRFFSNITFTSFNEAKTRRNSYENGKYRFFESDLTQPISNLGFITSSRLVFDITNERKVEGKLDTSKLIEAFDPQKSNDIFFPEYNISSRTLYRFNETPVRIISPSDPPKKPEHGLFYMVLPSLISISVLVTARLFFLNNGNTSNLSMILLSASMGLTAVISTALTWMRQKKEYAKSKKRWKTEYENYINKTISEIKLRQVEDTKKLDELYPDPYYVLSPPNGNNNEVSIYTLSQNVFSRAPADDDFLAFRLGLSNEVTSFFSVEGEEKDVVFSDAGFYYEKAENESYEDTVRILIQDDKGEKIINDNLCKLPISIKHKYLFLKNAPLLYSLKDKGALGVVDSDIDNPFSKSNYLFHRMLFELCYYHSPENLQFVVFFNQESEWNRIEKTIQKYKFMPHFRGLFDDRAQFVFDDTSAGAVLGRLFSIMNARKERIEEGNSANRPHIVLVVFDEHGMKEHSFAEYLPKARGEDESVADYGLSFVFFKKYKEYLPEFCDDTIHFSDKECVLIPRHNQNDKKKFWYPLYDVETQSREHFFSNFDSQLSRALRFFSAIYYSKIAQDAKVPSLVDMFELFSDDNVRSDDKKWAENYIRTRWNNTGSVTKSLDVPIGRTGIGTVSLDLHERAAGPHMLVAGKTGSGKTETIITYLLGLCMNFRPDELNLLLVDMKGGGFTNRLGMLPHVVGKITDVDGDENNTGAEYMLARFLFSMKAEIKRRKLMLNKMHVDSIDDYINAYNNIDSHLKKINNLTDSEKEEIKQIANNKEDKLTHLIIIVDEFTELKRFSSENADVDYISEITTIARVGRSLGIHIILISQNIEGAITDDIRVNCSTRLCLKVATVQASKEMIGTPAAAAPSMPGFGRAYLSVNGGAQLEYFQSGYSKIATIRDIPISITLANKCGGYSLFYQSDKDNTELKKKSANSSKTQIETVVDAISTVYAERKTEMGDPHQVFRAPLPRKISMYK